MAGSEPQTGNRPPEKVLTFGGNSKIYHRAIHLDGLRGESTGIAAACGAHTENRYLKDRATIASHYRPCSRCFPGGVDG